MLRSLVRRLLCRLGEPLGFAAAKEASKMSLDLIRGEGEGESESLKTDGWNADEMSRELRSEGVNGGSSTTIAGMSTITKIATEYGRDCRNWEKMHTLLHSGPSLSLEVGQETTSIGQGHQQRTHAVEVHEVRDELVRLRANHQVLQTRWRIRVSILSRKLHHNRTHIKASLSTINL